MVQVRKSIKKKRYGSAVVHLLSLPVEKVVEKVKVVKENHKNGFAIVLGTIVLLTGAFLASVHQDWVPHFVWDAGAYGIHGLGIAPIAKVVFDIIKVEI